MDGEDAGLPTVPWVCSPNLESLSVVEAKLYGRLFYLGRVTADIRAAMEASRAGRRFYFYPRGEEGDEGVETDRGLKHYYNDKDYEQYRGLVPAKKLRPLETVSGMIQDHDLTFLLDHVEETMQVLCVPNSQAGALTVKALVRHYTIWTKLNVRITKIDSQDVLTIMHNCPRLESLGATGLLGAGIVANEESWACM